MFYVSYTIFAAPWVALGYELTPDYHERTRLMGVQNFIGQLAYVISPWFLWIMTHKPCFPDPAIGARGLAIAIGVTAMVIGVLPAIFRRERFQHAVEAAPAKDPAETGLAAFRRNMATFFHGFGTTVRSKPFLKL